MSGTHPPIFWLGKRQWEYPPILLRTFWYSRPRPILVVLAQWQHLIDVFYSLLCSKIQNLPKCATESTRTPLRELTIKNFNFSTSEFTKIYHFPITKQKISPSPDLSPGGEEYNPGGEGNTHPFGASSPQPWTRVDATVLYMSPNQRH